MESDFKKVINVINYIINGGLDGGLFLLLLYHKYILITY